jgi:hypothetical protein
VRHTSSTKSGTKSVGNGATRWKAVSWRVKIRERCGRCRMSVKDVASSTSALLARPAVATHFPSRPTLIQYGFLAGGAAGFLSSGSMA